MTVLDATEVKLDLIVLRVSDIEHSRQFYEALGLKFSLERHGTGPQHFAAQLSKTVFEIYPQGTGTLTTGLRLGFRVGSVQKTISSLQQMGVQIASPPTEGQWGPRAVVVDPSGNRVELSQ